MGAMRDEPSGPMPSQAPGLRTIAVFCGSLPGREPRYRECASAFGALVADRAMTLVYGGGRVGLMGAVADGALAAGGRVIGVIPRALVDRELAHPGLSDIRVTASMHERKAVMAELSDAFVALPGGAGTLDELFEAWTWTMLGIHAKPCALLDVGGFYGGLQAHVATMVSSGFIDPTQADGLIVDSDAPRLLDRLAAWVPPSPKWSEGPPP
jgi:uncharacterized protein (TIGR00730 family)